jgi:hypothetical protein
LDRVAANNNLNAAQQKNSVYLDAVRLRELLAEEVQSLFR